MQKGETPNIVATSYINSIGEPEQTATHNIDTTPGALIQQTEPNDGTLKAIGKLGIKDMPATYAFDSEGTENGQNMAYLVAGMMLYTADLAKLAVTAVGAIEGVDSEVRDIAIPPAM